MITIIDYGMGNLRSVQKAFEKVGTAAAITCDPDMVRRADRLVLPGVGACGDAMECLRGQSLIEPIKEHVASGRPFLGVCLGLQMLFTKSYEGGEHAGLDLFAGEVVRFREEATVAGAAGAANAPAAGPLKVPHMGWNQLRICRRAPILAGIESGSFVYFVHSYHAVPRDRAIVATETDYPTPFTSSIWHENVFATQFHPEKSQQVGLQLLRNFATL